MKQRLVSFFFLVGTVSLLLVGRLAWPGLPSHWLRRHTATYRLSR